ncbi:tetratricopeptide repeat protein [Leptobacterium flavescens]|uniref:Tetratricopeptide repeat protein n=1 Tax=Leptobacterium flavescens TaxID=472055 RepID=A0A6P0UHJ2_9FLAO|nr:alpha/beta hydrolase-fold protein [Leptobacterium flavescens]NER12801.1 tetratricopeptide repeat protein [Leptobacterium flavescens]
MNNRALLFLFLACFCLNFSFAQNSGADNVIGKRFQINSEILGQEREIQVLLPESYTGSEKKYPVVFLLDGQRLFLYGASLLKSFTQFEQTPEFIVVGINNSYPQRFGHFSSGAEKFQEFIEKDILNFIDTNFRTSGERILFAWEYAGSFAIGAMISRPELFGAYLIASPFPLNEKVPAMADMLSQKQDLDKFLYFSVSVHEDVVGRGTESLDSLLRKSAPKALNWKYKKFQDEEHRSTPYPTLYHGLKHYYKYYPELQFTSLNELEKAGGIPYVYDYYKKRAKQFGFSPELTSWTKFTIIRNAIRADNYKSFDDFVNRFKTKEFISGLRNNRPYSIGEFYEKYKEYDKALEIYNILREKQADNARPYYAIGNVYFAQGNTKEAEKNYKRAVELAEKNGDRRLERYREALNGLKK